MKNTLRSVIDWLKQVLEEQKDTQQKSTIAVLDGVRALAILFVITFHINWSNKNYMQLWDWHAFPFASTLAIAGESGVTLFFVLSGFLLFMPYARALLFAGDWPLTFSFYIRRALRILPAYYLSLFVLILWERRDYLLPQNFPRLLLFLSFFMDSSKLTFRLLDGPYWTLAVECQFYMILPFIALGILLLVRRLPLQKRLRAVAFCLLAVLAVSLLARLWGFYYRDNPRVTFWISRQVLDVMQFFTFGSVGKYTEVFAVGMLASLCYVYAQKLTAEHRFVRNLRRLNLWFLVAGLLILVFTAMWQFQADKTTPAWPFLNPLMPYYNWLSDPFQSVGYGLCILALLFGPRGLQRPLTWAPLRWIGLISFSLYIWHLPLFQLLQALLRTLPGLNFYAGYALYWVWVLVVTFPFCGLCYIWIEKSGMRLGDRWRKAIEARRLVPAQAVQGRAGPAEPRKLKEHTATPTREVSRMLAREKAEAAPPRK